VSQLEPPSKVATKVRARAVRPWISSDIADEVSEASPDGRGRVRSACMAFRTSASRPLFPPFVDTGPVSGVLCQVVIGREAELKEIGEALDGAAQSSKGMVLFVAGEAGIGKSRVAQEAIARARASRFVVLSGRATIPHRTVAFRPLTEALFSYFRGQRPPELPELELFPGALGRLVPAWRRADAAGDESIVVLAEAVVQMLRGIGRRTGCLLVLDDLQWADPETLSIIEYLAENIATEPVVCLCTVRSEEPSAGLALADALAARRTASLLALARLSPAETTTMALACLSAEALPESVDALLADSADGLPFFVEELLAGAVGSGALGRNEEGWTVQRALEPRVPRTFLDSVEGRLGVMGELAEVLVAAAVLGRRFDWTLLSAITGCSEPKVLAALRAGVDAQLLAAEPSPKGSFRFRHALTRDAIVQSLLPMEHASLARPALDAIEAVHPGLPDAWCDLAGELAERAGDDSRAAALLIESGRRSRSQGALASAEDAFTRARVLAHGEPTLAADADEALCEALSLSGKLDQALVVGDRFFAALDALPTPPARLGRVHLWLARAAVGVARWDVAQDHVRRAYESAAAAQDAELSASIDAVGAALALASGDVDRANELARRARASAIELGQHEVACEALEVIGRAARVRDIDEAEAAFSASLAIAERQRLEVWRVRALYELGSIDQLRGLAASRLGLAHDAAVANGALATAAHIDFLHSLSYLTRLEFEDAFALAHRSGEVARRFQMQSLHALSLAIEGATFGWQGHDREMEVRLDHAMRIAGDDSVVAGTTWMLARGVSFLIVEKRDRALAALDTGMESLRRSPSAPLPQRGLWALVRAVEGIDGQDACEKVRASGVLVHQLNRGFVGCAEAVLAGRIGDKDLAVELANSGGADLAGAPWFQQLACRLMAEAAITDGWGDPVTWLRDALATFEGHAQERLVTACRSLLSKAGAPMPRRRKSERVPSGLREIGVTEREHEVLTLLAEGLANKEIAARLFMSPRTVERHIANVTVKVGLRTRAELVAFAARNVER
jgi:DNA-binding CsgD family transcriptional regulator/tetratricopeptide (TPR) repeat protein